MTQTMTALFDHYVGAQQAVRALEAAGVPHDDIAVVANTTVDAADAKTDATEEDAGKGAGIGALVGGSGGLLASLGLLVIPGVGHVMVAGWLGSMAIGALAGGAVGGATGGLVGALTHAGIAEEHAHIYAEGVRRGGAVVTVRTSEAHGDATRRILGDLGSAVDIARRGDRYRQQGWTRFDETAPVYTRDQIEAERATHLFV